ncbi:integral membrane protein [Streptomyces davaonensis JCM 4913]|uniref:Integral membrane protein n=1 Tax=Streptomyces davaonensis (strain DSM 101723 / JCM 4913 / KCC S-0913 / 768) TaxID=1214101 RepID=K4QSU8_STRDJ|nr:integral membrane protein [Streptomyces davaonensis]CCK25276.1 integral membrane protein [Streptomyces davaonensis JCM 4913]
MTKFLLTLHVLAAIVAVGPVTVAGSMFPPAARTAKEGRLDTVRLLHRICRVYSGIGLAVPLLGFATAASMGVLGDAWLVTSMTLTAVAAGVLVAFVLPRQDEILEQLAAEETVDRSGTVQLAMFTGIFNLLWATVTVLMIVRPGSTTGA